MNKKIELEKVTREVKTLLQDLRVLNAKLSIIENHCGRIIRKVTTIAMNTISIPHKYDVEEGAVNIKLKTRAASPAFALAFNNVKYMIRIW